MRDYVIEVVVDSWEIECCAPPPVVGEQSSWRPLFIPSDDHPLAAERRWTVAPHAPAARLYRAGVTAAWGNVPVAPPEPGEHVLRGFVYGAAHVFPEDLPPLTGRVRRVRVISEEFAADPAAGQTLRPVPDSLRTREVDASPRSFALPDVQASPVTTSVTATGLRWSAAIPGTGRHETGVVVDLVVPM